MKQTTSLLVLIFFFLQTTGNATEPIQVHPQKKWYQPQFTTMQFAGNIGFLSVGIGTQFFNARLQTSLLYGYVPKSIGNVEIHTISIKNAFILDNRSGYNLDFSSYIGHTLSFETGNNSFAKLPDKYPKGYYAPNAFHFTLFVGGKIHKDLNKCALLNGIDLYTEVGSLDTYLWYWLSSKEVKLKDILSMSIGINLYF